MAHGHTRKKGEEGGLIITSLIDIFTVLVIFLLQNFSADGSLMSNAENMTLPYSASQKKLTETTLQLVVTPDMIVLDNVPVVPTKDVSNISKTEATPIVLLLQEKLRQKFAQEEEMVRLGALNKVEGNIIIQMDKNTNFDVLFKVMLTCGSVGYNNMRFAVIQREEG